jgi:hypothetical protein
MEDITEQKQRGVQEPPPEPHGAAQHGSGQRLRLAEDARLAKPGIRRIMEVHRHPLPARRKAANTPTAHNSTRKRAISLERERCPGYDTS